SSEDLELRVKHNRTSSLVKPDERRMQEGFLRAPLEVGIEISSRCQLKCIHCYGAFDYRPPNNELNDIEIYDIIGQLDKLGNFAVFVGGGEPTIHPSFFDICKSILSKDMNVVVSSNGQSIDEKAAQSFADLGSYVGVQISLEGPNEGVNDAMRGRGSFRKAVRGLKFLQEAGLNPTIGTTITSLNYNSVEGMVNLAHELGVPHVHFMCLMPSGRGDLLYERLKLTAEQRIWLTCEMRRLKEKHKGTIGLDCANFYQQPPSKQFDPNTAYDSIDKVYAGCEASRVKAVITSTGDVIGCEIIRNYIAGNIREKSFQEIWEDREIFGMIRKRNAKTLEGKCSSCNYLAACVGDCPSYSIQHGKSFFAGGEECPHEPEQGDYKIIE
ncbi:MAG: radical SAM protein, partial [Nanoarchaeota archaeon]|nr:radical SAM protein [Nanoarchaeota archaeon]